MALYDCTFFPLTLTLCIAVSYLSGTVGGGRLLSKALPEMGGAEKNA